MIPKRAHALDRLPQNLVLYAVNLPPKLRKRFSKSTPPKIASRGSLGLLNNRLIAFFCSVRCPGDIVLKTYDLARALRSADTTIVGGFQSPMEKECLSFLLRGTISVVVCPARGLGRMRVSAEWKKSLADGRLLILSIFDDNVRRSTTELAAKRNAYVATLADHLLIAYAEPGGKTEELCKDALVCGKPVFTLDSPDNAHLIELGAVPVPANDPTPLLAPTSPAKPCDAASAAR